MARTSRTITAGAGQIPILDRSRHRLRLPVDILPEALRQASGEGLASPLAAVRLETGGVLTDDGLDPVAVELLRVIAAASLMVAVEVTSGADSSVTTVWATPHRAVVTSCLDPELVDVEPIRVSRLPETLSDLILLTRPTWTHDRSVTVSSLALAAAEQHRGDADLARIRLRAAGVTDEGAIDLLVAMQSPGCRRWRITSTWSAVSGQERAELEGIDTLDAGQWLIERVSPTDEAGEVSFAPQGDGDTLRALRRVLPRAWVGAALNPRPPA